MAESKLPKLDTPEDRMRFAAGEQLKHARLDLGLALAGLPHMQGDQAALLLKAIENYVDAAMSAALVGIRTRAE